MHKAGNKRRFITLEQKVRLIEETEANPHETRTSIARRFNVPITTLKSILNKKDVILKHAEEAGPAGSAKRCRTQTGMYTELEQILFNWYREQTDLEIFISGTHLKEKALDIAKSMNIKDFKASSGWVDKFRKRHNLSGKGYVANERMPDLGAVREWLGVQLKEITTGYRASDIYTFSEAGLYYIFPKNINEQNSRKNLLMTVLIGVNADGSDKLDLLVIGRDEDPDKSAGGRSLPTDYVWNINASIDESTFRRPLEKLNERMIQEKRHPLVLIDTDSVSPKLIQGLHFSNLRVEYFTSPSDTKVQHLNLGFIDALKMRYRKLFVQRAIATLRRVDATKDGEHPSFNEFDKSTQISIIEAMEFVAEAWNSIHPDAIAKYFRLAGVTSDSVHCDEPYPNDGVFPLAVEMEIGDSPDDWDKISGNVNYRDFIRQNVYFEPAANDSLTRDPLASDPLATEPPVSNPLIGHCKEEPTSESEETSDPEAGSDDEGKVGDRKNIPTFTEALRAYELAARYITSKDVSQKDMAVVADFARVLYDAYASSSKAEQKPEI